MNNPEIVTYIRTESLKGTNKQVITSSLLANGWNTQDIEEAFKSIDQGNSVGTVSRIWTKIIPRTNVGFLIPCLLLVFGLDMYIALNDSSLLEFWYIMLWVFAASVIFFILENFVFKRIFANSQSKVDGYISTLVILRNILVLLNVIPLIQILGMLIGFFAVWIYVPLYILLIIIRFSHTKKNGVI